MDSFVDAMEKNQEGIGDVEDYINEDEIDLHVHKKILEMAPDIFTSLGILGTFIGLVWGLKSFEPSSYETMTTSVSALVDGIKVAFLTSIYGIAFALIYRFRNEKRLFRNGCEASGISGEISSLCTSGG